MTSVFDGYNQTELLQACARARINVVPSTAREQLISYLDGEVEPPDTKEIDNIFHSWRYGIIGFLNDHWREIESQITCPARDLRSTTNPNPKPCFGCLDTQVVSCLIENSKYIPLIESHRLKRRPVTK